LLFGGLRISQDGRSISPPPYRTYGLLVFLLLREKLPIRRERLGGLLFGDLPKDKSRGRISDHIWQIKKYLPRFPLIATSNEVSLDRQFIWVDVKAFQNEINTSKDPLSEKFIDLYQGELLPELYDDWLVVERERWHSHYLRNLRKLINNLLTSKEFDRAILQMERLLRTEPYDENTVRLLMQTFAQVGRRGAALATYENFHVLSTEEIGLEPDEKTKQIYETIKKQASATRHLLSNNTSPPPTLQKPDNILCQAQSVLEQGDRFELNRLLDTLPQNLSYDQVLWLCLLKFDECLTWGELDQAEQLLQQYNISTPSLRLRQAKLALARHNPREAKSLVDTLLDDAHRLRQPELEAEALLIISMADSELGEIQSSLTSLDRVISLARKIDAHTIRVQAYIQKGKYWRLKGAEESAQGVLEQAVSLARKNNQLPLLCQALGECGTTANYYGNYHDSLKCATESLELARDLGLRNLEASSLLTLSTTYDFLGRHTETAEALKNASRIFEEKHDEFGLAKCHYNLAYSIGNREKANLSDAIEYAEKALRYFSKTNNLGWIASTHTALGYFCWLAKQPDQAIENFDAAIKIHTELDEHLFIPEINAYKGLAYLQKGKPKQGLEFTLFAIHELARQNLSDVAAEIYYAHACAILALGDKKEANIYTRLGYETYLDFAKEIDDDNARAAYFERDPITRRLMQMAYDFGIAPKPKRKIIIHELPGIQRYKVKFALSADAGPADQALEASQGSSALRRARLKRILKEGKAHGSQLSIQEIADLFNVSPRTIHRDLKILEKDE